MSATSDKEQSKVVFVIRPPSISPVPRLHCFSVRPYIFLCLSIVVQLSGLGSAQQGASRTNSENTGVPLSDCTVWQNRLLRILLC
eukprot:5313362-Amphidinium_carterae.1